MRQRNQPQKNIASGAGVLVVEDSEDVRQFYVHCLEGAGYSVREARDGVEAMRLANEARPDLVLLDIALPGTDGYTLAKHWNSEPGMASVPVIVLSGRSGEEHEVKARRSGVVLTLKKPCTPDLILAAVRGALRP
jgi:DNA-binding response OmpR family regulator